MVKTASPFFPPGLLLALAILGCESSSTSWTNLEGTVTLDTQPLETGTITFIPVGSGQALGTTIRAGHFRAERVPLGEVVVRFHATRPTGKMNTDYSEPFPEVLNVIPNRYHGGMKITITGDQRRQDFVLHSTP